MGKEMVIGLDLGGTFLKYALGMPDGTLLMHKKTPSKGNRPKEEIFQVIFDSIQELLIEAEKIDGFVSAIGIGSPGAINFDLGKQIGSTPNLPYWIDADMRGEIEKKFSIPTWADNDANVMAFAEARQGAAKGYKYMIALTLGTGIGGGILINNEIFRGANFAGAELGHLSVDIHGIKCNCGGIGCIERYASATGMALNYAGKKKIDIEQIKTEMIFANADNGEKEAIDTIEETCEYLGSALASYCNIFNPEIIVIGGGVADAGDEFLNKIKAALDYRAMPAVVKDLKLVKAKLGNKAGIVGAMSLAAEMVKKTKSN